MNKVITRFPPSPTGYFHIGSARTALFNYLFTKNQGGEMILRFEDTDKERNKPEFEEDILDGLKWLGIGYNNKDIYKQSERTELYKKHIQELIDSGNAYVSKETEGERDEVVRFKNPKTKIKFNDLVRGEVEFDTSDLGDFVIAKSLEEPVYHLTVVVDDAEMNITHVIRGEDHISNTPRQILILEALGFERPVYGHIPLVLAQDRSKLSKRNGVVSITEYRKMGYLPEAFVNYLALLGWNPGDEREIFSMEELVKEFDINKVQKGGAIFDLEKLDWINKNYLSKLPDEDFLNGIEKYLPEDLKNHQNFSSVLPVIKERVSKFSEVKELVDDGEFSFYSNSPNVSAEKIVWKEDDKQKSKENLSKVVSLIQDLEDFSKENLKEVVQPFADEAGRGSVLHPMRFSLTGRDRSPDPFTVSSILGKEETINRLNKAIEVLG